MIEVKNIFKKYGEQVAINDISFSINQGEIVGFLGPNGAGKSTMMKIINSYISSDGGEVKIAGLDISKNSIDTKKKIGYLPENNPLYTEMYVREYLEYVAELYEVPSSEIEEVIDVTGLKNEANKNISQLSKGYKQRVGLAAAIIHNPEYLILDEPTTGLDPNQIVEIRSLIKSFGKQKTILLSTHILQEVEAMCDRVIIINKGNLVLDEKISDFSQDSNDKCTVVFDKEVEQSIIETELGVEILENSFKKIYSFVLSKDGAYKRMAEFSAKNNVNIIEFKVSKKSLEDIFAEVTVND